MPVAHRHTRLLVAFAAGRYRRVPVTAISRRLLGWGHLPAKAPYPWWMEVLVVDAANVVGSRPDGWWRDRAGAARRLHDRLSATELPQDEVVLVLEGEARRGRRAGQEGRVRTVHAAGSGDDAVVDEVMRQVAIGDGRGVIVVTADRMLRDRVETAGVSSRSPGWLLDQL